MSARDRLLKVNITTDRPTGRGDLAQIEREVHGVTVEEDGTLLLLDPEGVVIGEFGASEWAAFAVEWTPQEEGT